MRASVHADGTISVHTMVWVESTNIRDTIEFEVEVDLHSQIRCGNH